MVDTPDRHRRRGAGQPSDARPARGRTASSGGAPPGSRAPSRLPSWVVPTIVLTLVAGLGIGLAVGMLIGGDGSGQAATTTTAAGTTTTTAIAWEPADAYGAPVTVTGEPPCPVLDPDRGAEDTAIGLALPEISGTDYDGNALAITADGRAKLIVALAHWCPYCNAEMPILQEWYAAGVPEGVEVFALSVYADPSRANFPPADLAGRTSVDPAR